MIVLEEGIRKRCVLVEVWNAWLVYQICRTVFERSFWCVYVCLGKGEISRSVVLQGQVWGYWWVDEYTRHV